MSPDPEIFVSIDCETSGPIPGPHSMLSLGAAAFSLPDETPLRTFSVNLIKLPDSEMDQSTAAFWDRYPKEYAATREHTKTPEMAMGMFADWLRPFGNNLVAVCYPLGFDWTFVHWYFIKFLHRNPFGLSGIDLKTMAWTRQQTAFRETTKKTMPKEWSGPKRHQHIAVDDAVEQGVLFVRMWKAISNSR